MIHLGVYSTERHKKQFSRLLRLLKDAFLTQSDPDVLRNVMASICFLTSSDRPHPCSTAATGSLRSLAVTVCSRLSHYLERDFSAWQEAAAPGRAGGRAGSRARAKPSQGNRGESSAINRECAISLWMRRLRFLVLQSGVANALMQDARSSESSGFDSVEKALTGFLRRRVSGSLLNDIDRGTVTIIGDAHSAGSVSRRNAPGSRVASPSAASDALHILMMSLFWHGQSLEENSVRSSHSLENVTKPRRSDERRKGGEISAKINERRDVLLQHIGAVFEATLSGGEHSEAAQGYLNTLKANVRFVVTNLRLYLSQRLRFTNTCLRTLSWNPTEYQLMHLLNQFHVAMEQLDGTAHQQDEGACEEAKATPADSSRGEAGEERRLQRRDTVVLPFAAVTISGNSPPTMREGSALLQYMKIDYDTTTRQLLKIANRKINDRSGTRNHIKMQLLSLKHIFRYAMSLQTLDVQRRDQEIAAAVKLARNFAQYYSAKMLLGHCTAERRRSLYFSVVDVVRAGMMYALSPAADAESTNIRFLEVVCQYLKLILNDSLLIETEYKGENMVQEFWLALEEKYPVCGFPDGSAEMKAISNFKGVVFKGNERKKKRSAQAFNTRKKPRTGTLATATR